MVSHDTTSPPATGRRTARSLWERVWIPGGVAIAAIVIAPLLAILWLAFFPAENIWPHLFETILPRHTWNTIVLMAGNGLAVFVIGTSTAWLVASCDFPGRRMFEWALLLPLAAPAYIVAFVYTDIFEFAGPVQGLLRDIFGWQTKRDYWFPEIRSMGGAIFVMSFVLYPYVYLLARASFMEQSESVREASRVLGRGRWRTFFSVSLPLARPAIVVGITLALMETLADFGTVDYFAVNTLTRSVFDVWLHMGNAGGAAQIAVAMLAFVIILIYFERLGRRGRRFHNTSVRHTAPKRLALRGAARWGAVVACALPVTIGFLIPGGVLARHAVVFFDDSWNADFLGFAGNSLMLAAMAACGAVTVAVFLAYGRRLSGRTFGILTRLSLLGYAVPGAVLAVGILIPLARFDNALDALMRDWFGVSTGLLLSGTIFALVFAYVVRFLAVAYGAVESSLGNIQPTMDMAARSLGAGPGRTLWRIHLPLIRGSLLAGATIVFVDTMKELPATLILRPFNFDTLATHVYQFASDELLEQSALSALTIVIAGIVPVILLSRAMRSTQEKRSRQDNFEIAAPLAVPVSSAGD
ncbi:MAG: iron ABC transporter permease [Alphaproteobacteria bacterium]|nr:iron ABC transporter permease [Alphaproteobacteria bacterium]